MTSLVLHISTQISSLSELESAGSSPDAKHEGIRHTKRGLLITFQNISYSITPRWGTKLTLLDGITGYFEPGQVTAVLGPSGSGKTTLLDVLAGRKTSGSLSGSIRFGGLPPTRSLLRRATGYVEQFDTLVDTLSCQEMLLYTAQLKRPRHESLSDKQAAVQQLLDKLGLRTCASTQIGSALKRGISGGQAKRLNIGIALITDPRVLFLDEPTSGLDSFTANEVLSVVAALAKDGTTIATTIHSPSSYCFGLFDRLLVLMAGKVIYLGTAGQAAIEYFTASLGARQPRVGDNLAEWMLEAATHADRISSSPNSCGPGVSSSSSCNSGDVVVTPSSSKLASTYQQQMGMQNQQQLEVLLVQEQQKVLQSASRQDLQQLTRMSPGTSSSRSSGTILDCSSSGWGSTRSTVCWASKCSTASDTRGLDKQAYVTPAWWSLKVLLWYRTGQHYCTPSYILPRVLEKALFAAVVLSLYWGKGADLSTMNVPVVSSLLFLMILAPICAAVLYLPSMMVERLLFIRETSDGLYRPLTYLLFKLLDELVIMAPVSAVTAAAVFYACKLQGSYLLFWLVGYLTLANGTALSYFLASASPNMSVAMGVLPFLLCMALILCGFMIRTPAMPKYWSWAVKLNVVHYSWGALVINQYRGQQTAGFGGSGSGVLTYFGLPEAQSAAWSYLGVVVAFFFGWTALAWLALAFARNHRR